jgi:hypothetical protein
MGRKGVSKRKPKKTKSDSNDNNHRGSSNVRLGESSTAAQPTGNANAASMNRGGANPSAGSSKKNRNGR